MGRRIKDPKAIFPAITADYKEVFGDDLVSIMLYGSAAGKDYRPGKSDINFMIILSEEGIEQLDLAFKTVAKWQKRRVAVPLFLTENYVETSLDVYPIEYLNFQRNYRLVYGKDVLKGLKFVKKDLRLQCEREIKGKLLLLRAAFIETAGKKNLLKRVIAQSFPAFIAFFKALLYLKGKKIPTERRKIIKDAAEEFQLDFKLFQDLQAIKEGRVKPKVTEMNKLFKGYLKEVRKLAKLVDKMGG
jgi:predicted nucleotidyltransferase